MQSTVIFSYSQKKMSPNQNHTSRKTLMILIVEYESKLYQGSHSMTPSHGMTVSFAGLGVNLPSNTPEQGHLLHDNCWIIATYGK